MMVPLAREEAQVLSHVVLHNSNFRYATCRERLPAAHLTSPLHSLPVKFSNVTFTNVE
jgi:hypothetical protein